MNRPPQKRMTRRILLIPLVLLLLLCAAFLGYRLGAAQTALPDDSSTNLTVVPDDGVWNLILVNRDHPLPEDYEVNLTELSNGEQVDSRIYPALQQMFDDARAQGVGLYVAAGYRTTETQQQLMDEKIAEYEAEGHDAEEAKTLAEEWVAIPGTSEHQLGIAVDINAGGATTSDELYTWLAENAYQYGFIQRYPSDKTEITHIIHEPWHYRYVGKEAAEEITQRGICLEEYLGEADGTTDAA